MKHILIFLLLISAFAQSQETITWSSNYALQWPDFKGEPRINGDAVAVTASGITFGYSTTRYDNGRIDYEFDIKAQFYPNRSYYLKERVTQITLDHERLHFDIAELHARKFRQIVAQTRFSRNIDNEVEAIYNRINRDLREMQQLYDRETNHSINIEKQKAWQEYVANQLSKFGEFD